MLPDLSPAHILIVVVVALIVVGPKDLPKMLRKLGQFMGKMRGMANEFRASFDEMARQSELDELRKEVQAMRDAANAETEKIAHETDFTVPASIHADAESAAVDSWYGAGAPAEQPVMTSTNPAKAKTTVAKGKPTAKPAKAPAKAKAESKAATASKGSAPAKPRAKKAKPASEAEA